MTSQQLNERLLQSLGLSKESTAIVLDAFNLVLKREASLRSQLLPFLLPPTKAHNTKDKEIMILSFTLSMPGSPSWNGRWSGEGKLYAIITNLGKTQKAEAKGRVILSQRSYSYRWSDGWCACIDVKEVDAKEAQAIRRRSVGFCGYDWMVRSIRDHGEIYADHELPKKVQVTSVVPATEDILIPSPVL